MGLPEPVSPEPERPDFVPGAPEGAREALRDHSLLALVELGHELTVAANESELARTALFNLMGHAGTAQAAIWLIPEGAPGRLKLVRCHGVNAKSAAALSTLLERDLSAWADPEALPVPFETLCQRLDPAGRALVESSGLAVLAPVSARSRLLGFVALGRHARGSTYTNLDLELLRTSAGMVGVAFENSRLYHQLRSQNEELVKANAALRELDRMKSEFLQNVNHELRTPITVITGAAECLIDEPDVDQRRKRLMQAMMAQAHKLREMIQALLDFSSAMSGRPTIECGPFNPAPVIQNYFEAHEQTVSESGRELRVSIASPVSYAHGDLRWIEQILDRLIDNATKFTPEGTTIELELCDRVERGHPWVRIAVRDDGPGIPPEHLDSVFAPFSQVDGSTTRAVGGLGLGLAMAKRVAEMMSGTLTVESEPGRGTTFQLLLRRA